MDCSTARSLFCETRGSLLVFSALSDRIMAVVHRLDLAKGRFICRAALQSKLCFFGTGL